MSSPRFAMAYCCYSSSCNSSESEEEESFYCNSCDRSFGSRQALQNHFSQSSRHNYCRACEKHFRNANELRHHRASKRHQPPSITCPVCKSGFVSAEALTKHMEKSGCYNLSNKQIVNKVRDWEQKSGNPNLFTLPRIGWHNNNDDLIGSKIYATEASFDGHSYVCPFCDKGFRKLASLNQHLNSNAHEPSEFRCRKCGKTFKELSALVGHVESEACGAMTAGNIRNIVNNIKTMSLTY